MDMSELVEKFKRGCLAVKGEIKEGRGIVTCFLNAEGERLVMKKDGEWVKVYTMPPFSDPYDSNRIGLHAWVVPERIEYEENNYMIIHLKDPKDEEIIVDVAKFPWGEVPLIYHTPSGMSRKFLESYMRQVEAARKAALSRMFKRFSSRKTK